MSNAVSTVESEKMVILRCYFNLLNLTLSLNHYFVNVRPIIYFENVLKNQNIFLRE